MTIVDRRFGEWNKYGTSTKFGASSGFDSLAWGFEVDWNGDGVFDGTNEARRVCGFRCTRGRTAMLKSTGQGFETLRTGKAVITLWNDDGRYDGWNTASALYPNVSPGKDVRIRVRDMSQTGEVIQSVFYGTISDIVPMGYDERPKVNIYVDDGWEYLRNYPARVAMQENVSLDDAIGLVLDSIGWETRWGRSLTASSDTIRYWWGSGDRSAGAECEDLADSGFGNFFIGADGSARFVTRTTVTDSVANFYESELYKDIGNPQPWVMYRNVTQLRVHMRDQTSTALLYEQFGDAISIPIGETFVDFVSYAYNGNTVSAVSIVTPVANTDYTINSNAAGSGSDVSGSCTVTVTNFGDRAKRSITNNSGAVAYIVTFKIRGVAVYERNTSDVSYPSNPSTVRNPRQFFMDLKWQQSANTARDFCDVYGPFLAASHPYPVIVIESNFSKQFGIELFDIVTVFSDKLGIGGVSFRVGGIDHEALDEGLQRMKTTFYLEPYVSSGSFGTFPLEFGASTFGW